MVNLSQNILTTDEQCLIRCVPPGVQLDYACGVVAIAIPSKTKQQIAIGLSFSFSRKGDRHEWNKSKSAISFWGYGKGDQSFWYGERDF